MTLLFVVFVAYLIGSIPFGFILTKMAGLGDIRHIGSGNIGATNVLRTGNKGLAAVTLLLDGGKGALAVLLAFAFVPGDVEAAGLAVLIGHLFPIWLRCKGGKGVATAIGVLTALAWSIGLAVVVTWLLVAKIFRKSSLAALVGLGLSPIFAWGFGHSSLVLYTSLIAAIVWGRHIENIKRLIDGSEPSIGSGRPTEAISEEGSN